MRLACIYFLPVHFFFFSFPSFFSGALHFSCTQLRALPPVSTKRDKEGLHPTQCCAADSNSHHSANTSGRSQVPQHLNVHSCTKNPKIKNIFRREYDLDHTRTRTNTTTEAIAPPRTASRIAGELFSNILSKSKRNKNRTTRASSVASVKASHSSAIAAQLHRCSRSQRNSREMMILYPLPPQVRQATAPSLITPRACSDSNISFERGPTGLAPGDGRKK